MPSLRGMLRIGTGIESPLGFFRHNQFYERLCSTRNTLRGTNMVRVVTQGLTPIPTRCRLGSGGSRKQFWANRRPTRKLRIAERVRSKFSILIPVQENH